MHIYDKQVVSATMENEIIRLLRSGYACQQISAWLGVSRATVRQTTGRYYRCRRDDFLGNISHLRTILTINSTTSFWP
jgi:transposase-like protein